MNQLYTIWYHEILKIAAQNIINESYKCLLIVVNISKDINPA